MGMYKGTLIALEPTTRNKFGTVDTPEPAVRWRWKFQNLDGTDIIDPDTGCVCYRGRPDVVPAFTSVALAVRTWRLTSVALSRRGTTLTHVG
jgi:hypothetical protein